MKKLKHDVYVLRDAELARDLGVSLRTALDLAGKLHLEKHRVPWRGGTGWYISVEDWRKLVRFALEIETGHMLTTHAAMVLWIRQRLQDTGHIEPGMRPPYTEAGSGKLR